MPKKKWRTPLTLLILGVFVAAFLLLGSGADLFRKILLAPQLSTVFAKIGRAWFLAVLFLVVTAAAGRLYCSLLCPAGLTQELFHRLGVLLKTSRLRYRNTRHHIALLLLPTFATVLGFMFVANLFDPVGLFGRLAAPAGAWLRQAAGKPGLFAPAGPATMVILALGAVALALVPLFKGRWFCDTLCPVGAFLGVASRIGGRGVAIRPEKCVSCRRCEKICQTACIDAGGKRVESQRCVLCGDCADACGFDAIGVGARGGGQRRDFLKSTAGVVAAGVFAVSRRTGEKLRGEKPMPTAIVPAGAAGNTRHAFRCVTCQSCVPACPVGILQPAAPGMRPTMNYDLGYCQYNCVACAESCPAGVFDRIGVEEKQTTRIAETTLYLDRCVVVRNGTACGACAEVCPTHAVVMIDQGDGTPTLPDFKREYCIGCGACYHVCPALPRAFEIRGLSRHEVSSGIRLEGHAAEEDGKESGDGGEYELQDFPF